MKAYICDHCGKIIYRLCTICTKSDDAIIYFYKFRDLDDTEIHLCEECREVFQEWAVDFFHLPPFVAKKIVFKGKGKEEDTPPDSGSRPE